MTETAATSLRAISSNSFSWFSCLSNEGLGVSKCEKRFGSVNNNLWGNVHPLIPFFNIPMDAIFGAQQAATMFFFGVLPFTKRIHLWNDWAAHRVLQSETTHRQTLLQFLELSSFLAANQMSQQNACVYLALVFSSSMCSTFRCMSVCFFCNFSPRETNFNFHVGLPLLDRNTLEWI